MELRYIKNETMLTREENISLRQKRVLVAGCGGLGGNIIEQLARLGIGHITCIDGDVFDETNLNRQLLSNIDNIGKSKAFEAKNRIALVNPGIHIEAINTFITEQNAAAVLQGFDVFCDALDNIQSRMLLQKFSEQFNTPLVHGAIAGWYGQVCTLLPGDSILTRIYQKKQGKGIEQQTGNPAFTAAFVASVQVSEVIKLLTGKGRLIRNALLLIDLLENDYEVLEMPESEF